MTDKNQQSLDYQKLGFKCGLEIHQQLETHKLFCNCPSIVHDKEPLHIAKRKLKAVVGETGEIDAAASHEQEKSKEMMYEACKNSHCLVELDEEPPHEANSQSIEIAIQVSKMLHMDIVDEVQFMRKIVIDGSNVSGFQRTALIGMDGYIETSKGKVNVPLLCLEEEAAKKIESKNKDSTAYRLDRLGVCLLEIATDASIKDPEHAKECAEIIGMILRSTGKVKRGIGTIRQDVNVSIKGGVRVEVKGFQDLKSIPKIIDYEIKRQLSSLKKGIKLEKQVRKAEPDFTTSFLRPMPGGARMYPETDVLPLTISKELYDSIKIPELIADKKDNITKKYNLDQGLVDEIIRKNINFDSIAKKHKNIEPKFIASVLVQIPKELKRKEGIDTDKISEKDYDEILCYLDEGKISKDTISDLLLKKAKGEKISLSDYQEIDDSKLEAEIKKIIKEKPNLNIGGYMGLIMAKFKGKVDGKKASQIIIKHKK
ncbi:MAG: Glu-tRNA(Gln) amidotransferase subunit GatE [Candidatus Woesearchaeota archaeon]